ncbi:MAG: hypothetical protein MZV64_23590 [Ignavibacteriales bacterium]|nr:hypothetical protein [Ignavibacteriales bacterium]
MSAFDFVVRLVRDRLVEVRVEAAALRFDALHAFASNMLWNLRAINSMPFAHGIVRGAVLQRTFQVIQHRQDLLDDVALHVGAHHLVIAFETLFVVLEFRLRPLPAILVFGRLGFGLFKLLFQRFDSQRRVCLPLIRHAAAASTGVSAHFFVLVSVCVFCRSCFLLS